MREYKFVTDISSQGYPASDSVPQNDADFIPRKYLYGFRSLDLSTSADGVVGQILGDRAYLIINANTTPVALKGLIYAGIPEVTIINTMATAITVTPAPSVPANGFTEPPISIAPGKAHKFIRDFVDNIWVAMGGGDGGGGFTNIVTKTASGTIAAGEDCVLVDATLGPIVLTLPAWTLKEQHQFIRLDNSANSITIQRPGSTAQILTKEGNKTSVLLPYQGWCLKVAGISTNLWWGQYT